MEIALLGGTGDIGKALALRFGRDTDVPLAVGSRDAEKAAGAATAYEEELEEYGIERSITGADNTTVTAGADVVVLAVPPYYVTDTVEAVVDNLDDTIVVSPAVGMSGDQDGLHYKPPSNGSVAELVAATVPDGVPVVGACTNLSADRLADLDESFDMDTIVFGDDEDAKETVSGLVSRLEGVRTLGAGPLVNAAEVESLTALLINVAQNNEDVHDAGVKFV